MEKLSKTSPDIESMNIEQLKELFPSVVTEGKIDFDKLRVLLGDEIDESNEKYQFTWHGKNKSIRNAQAPSKGALIPDSKSSKHFDETGNLYIEGDNLEVLKLLQKTYYNKIKVVYIDPPYNTGNDLIYKNDYKDSIQNYKEQLKLSLRSNPETSGRYHTDWLNLMYSRILLGRNLLSDTGIMVLTIDHYELHNLLKISDEIFSEKNRIGIVTIVHKPEGRNQEKFFGSSNEFMLFYAKDYTKADFNQISIDSDIKEKFNEIDDNGSYRLKNFIRLSDGKYSLAENKPTHYYPIFFNPESNKISTNQDGFSKEIFPITKTGVVRTWKTKATTLDELIKNNKIVVINEKDDYVVYEKLYENQVIKTHWIKKEYHAYHFGTKVLDGLMGAKTFDFPKSLYAVVDTLKLISEEDSFILDFFSGSATTAHAVMKLNAEDGGNRKFIMVQLPEPTDPDSEAYKAGYENICEIGKERIRRAGEKVKQELIESVNKGESEVDPNQLDIGFKVFKLESTNIKEWDGSSKLTEDLLSMQEEVIKEGRTEQDVLYEVLLKYGVFDQPIETINIHNKQMYSVGQGYLLVCLADDITMDDITEIGKRKPHSVIFKESGFKDDNVKINALYTLERLGVEDIKSL